MPEYQPPVGEHGQGVGQGFEDVLRDSFASGVLLLCPPDALLTWSVEAARLLGIPLNASPPLPCQEMLPAALLEVLLPSLIEGMEVPHQWITLDIFGEAPQAVHISSLRLRNTGTKPQFLVVLRKGEKAADIEMRLQRLNRLASVGALSASLAHEIKNSLVGIKTYLSLTNEQSGGHELASVAARELDRINSMTARMLSLCAIAAPTQTKLNLHRVVDHALSVIGHEAAMRGVVVCPEFHASAQEIVGNAQRLEQAFLNIFLNALAAMERGGELRLVSDNVAADQSPLSAQPTSRSSHWIRLRITDSGHGIASEHLSHVFEPFYTTKANGTGLGLSITRDIVEEHGGFISVESAPGAGTTFRLLLPILEESA